MTETAMVAIIAVSFILYLCVCRICDSINKGGGDDPGN